MGGILDIFGGDPGDGGASAMRADEEQRRKNIAAAMQSINEQFDGRAAVPAHRVGKNKIFGIPKTGFPLFNFGPPEPHGDLTPGQTYYDEQGNPIVAEGGKVVGLGSADDGGVGAPTISPWVPPKDLYQGFEDVPEQAATKGFDDSYFKNIADSFYNFQKPMFDEQVSKARRELPYGLPTTDSSAYLMKKGELERDVTRQEADLRDKGESFANTQRGQVEQNRSDLVNMANSGTDASAVASMASGRAAALARPPVFTPIADLFQKYTSNLANGYQLQQAGIGGQAQAPTRPLLFGGGNSNAVRTVG